MSLHPYAVDSQEHKTVTFLLAVITIPISWGLSALLTRVGLSVPWWLDAPTGVLGIFGVLYAVFDRWLWRVPLLRQIGTVRTPDLNGKWKGYVASSHDEHRDRTPVEVEVIQRWTRIRIRLRTARSRSHSLVAGFLVDAPGGAILSYEYLNEPNADATGTMHAHRGVVRLRLDGHDQDGRLEGDYYTGRDRQNFGIIHLERQQ